MNVKPEEKPEEPEDCCEKSLQEDGKKCCKSKKAKNGQVIDSGLSKILLGVVSDTKEKVMTRHEARFGITSFIYRARRPFHPGKTPRQLPRPVLHLPRVEEGGGGDGVEGLRGEAEQESGGDGRLDEEQGLRLDRHLAVLHGRLAAGDVSFLHGSNLFHNVMI